MILDSQAQTWDSGDFGTSIIITAVLKPELWIGLGHRGQSVVKVQWVLAVSKLKTLLRHSSMLF